MLTAKLPSRLKPTFYFLRKLANRYSGALHNPVAGPTAQSTLTGLAGRAELEQAFNELCATCTAPTPVVAYLLFDCDNFSSINATFGHSVGDQLIMSLAARLSVALVGMSDARCFHLGADEFVVLLHARDATSVLEQAHLLQQRCSLPVTLAGNLIALPVSVGGDWTSTSKHKSLQEVSTNALVALRRAKRTGQPSIALYSATVDAASRASADAAMSHAVVKALGGLTALSLSYQPVVSCFDCSTPYFEVLSRLKSESGATLLPASFLPAVGINRLDVVFDLALIRTIRLALNQELALPSGSGLAINISVPGLHSTDVINNLCALHRHFPAVPLIVEVTEASFIYEQAVAHEALQKLRATGIRVALDDFGSGFSNLGYLLTLPLDIIKFDKTLVHGLSTSAGCMVAALARAAQSCGLSVVAEGVETEQQANLAKSVGFTHIQGFYFGHPANNPTPGIPASLAAD